MLLFFTTCCSCSVPLCSLPYLGLNLVLWDHPGQKVRCVHFLPTECTVIVAIIMQYLYPLAISQWYGQNNQSRHTSFAVFVSAILLPVANSATFISNPLTLLLSRSSVCKFGLSRSISQENAIANNFGNCGKEVFQKTPIKKIQLLVQRNKNKFKVQKWTQKASKIF